MENQPDFSDQPMENPYAAASIPAHSEFRPPRRSEGLPTFCLVYFIVDLIFTGFRAMLVFLALANLQNAELAKDPMVSTTAWFEIATGLGVVVLGVPANLLMLLQRRIGAYLAGLKIVATLGTFAVGIWQLGFILDRLPEGAPERMGAVVGAGMAMLVRLALLGLYVTAIVVFVRWLDRRENPAPGPLPRN